MSRTAPYNMRNLGGADNRNLSVGVYIGPGNRQLNMAVGNPGSVIFFFQSHNIFPAILLSGFFQSFFIGKIWISHSHMRMNNHIVFADIRVKRCGIFCHGSFYSNNGLVFFVFDLNQPCGPCCSDLVFCDNSCNVISVKPDSLV